MEKPVIFLDRDGVINFDSEEYIKSCNELNFIPGSIEAIANLSKDGYRIFLVTNQSVIGRKFVSPAGLEKIFEKLTNAVEAKCGSIEDIFFCPHLPEDNCDCRKPAPGMFYLGKDKYGLDLQNSVMVGDSLKDMLAADNAGCGYKILVLTGNGGKTLSEIDRSSSVEPDYIAENLFDAHEWIMENLK